ncbi:MAG: NAD(P)-dependent oxidoreductase [Chitinivibrionales bacterium]
MMLYFSRKINHIIDNQRSHRWERNFLSPTRRIGGSTVMILGYGAIGRHCARLLKGFGCRIIGVKRSGRDPDADRDADSIITPEQSLEHLPDVNHVVAILPATDQTKNILDARFFRSMPQDAFFYNMGRAHCCSEAVLIEALRDGWIAGAGLDVFEQEPLAPDSPLWDLDNVLIMPHATAISSEYLWMWLDELERQLR